MPGFNRLISVAIFAFLIGLRASVIFADVEAEGWGDLRGFRIDGQLFPVATSICVETADPKESAFTGHWQERDIQFSRHGSEQTFSGRFGLRKAKQYFVYATTIDPLDPNRARITVRVTPQQDSTLSAIYFSLHVPLADYAGAAAQLVGVSGPATRAASIATTQPATNRTYLDAAANGVSLRSSNASLAIDFDHSRTVFVNDIHDPRGDQLSFRILLHPDNVKQGDAVEGSFTLNFSGKVDHTLAHVTLNPTTRGSEFAGIGGNFVFNLDSPDVNYNLKNFHPVWARMAIPLFKWQPVETVDPDPAKIADVDAPGSEIRSTLELARRLDQQKIPLIFTVWVPPAWAINDPQPDEPYAEGRTVNPAKWDALCNSIVSYLLYAKNQYGVEPKLFSFNETDLGVTIKLTPQEYHDAIARLAACFAAHGIRTKFLIGDVSNPRPVDFIAPAVADAQLMKHAGAISYHSWNGATAEQLAAWHAAAKKTGLPLFVAEGGTDSDAYRYPHVFAQTAYAIDEAATYLDTLANAQPMSILPWELTSDYGMIDFHEKSPAPYKRFWCLKQLTATTSPGDVVIGAACDAPTIHAAAVADTSGGCAIHLANMGAGRDVTITVIPAGITYLKGYITDDSNEFAKLGMMPVSDGSVTVHVPPLSYLTLVGYIRE